MLPVEPLIDEIAAELRLPERLTRKAREMVDVVEECRSMGAWYAAAAALLAANRADPSIPEKALYRMMAELRRRIDSHDLAVEAKLRRCARVVSSKLGPVAPPQGEAAKRYAEYVARRLGLGEDEARRAAEIVDKVMSAAGAGASPSVAAAAAVVLASGGSVRVADAAAAAGVTASAVRKHLRSMGWRRLNR